MQTFTAFAAEKLGSIDVLVNNAGIMLSPLHELMIDVIRIISATRLN
jgi:NAD(P)-dependent dehydrogenase (short-subunit alcohol dehydrogenase family)